jgi:succinyl-CoA synthetase beta subunit
VVMASTEGGMDIEEVAHNTPEKHSPRLHRPDRGRPPGRTRPASLAFALGLSASTPRSPSCKLLTGLSPSSSRRRTAPWLEINPLIVTKGDEVMALDAKINFDSTTEHSGTSHGKSLGICPRRSPDGDRGQGGQSLVHPARREHRLSRERRRPGHGHHGHHQALRRRARELPRRGRRRHPGVGDEGLQDHPSRATA